jgi:hypothetical protein
MPSPCDNMQPPPFAQRTHVSLPARVHRAKQQVLFASLRRIRSKVLAVIPGLHGATDVVVLEMAGIVLELFVPFS